MVAQKIELRARQKNDDYFLVVRREKREKVSTRGRLWGEEEKKVGQASSILPVEEGPTSKASAWP